MKIGLVIYSMLLVSACATQGVHCDGHLQPINPPAPAASAKTAPVAAAPARRLP